MRKKQSTVFLIAKTFFFSLLFIWLIWALSSLFQRASPDPGIPAIAEGSAEDRRPVVILDPGHGGADPGAISVLGDEEKHINLAVAKALGEFLEAAGIRVVYTRSDDTMLTSDKTSSRKMGDLMARVELAAKYPEATFVSIHMNTLPIEKYNGLQVFYSGNHNLNKVLALQIQNDVKALLQADNHREVKDHKGSIYVLDRINSPSVLVECGFLSNQQEALLLIQEEYQNKLAYVLSRSVISFVLQRQNLE